MHFFTFCIMYRRSYYIVNAITIYRILAAFVLLHFIITLQIEVFRWLLAVSFFTDAIDGFLARKYKVTSAMGSRFDSVADDLTVLMAIIGIFVFKPDFIRHELVWVLILTGLYLIQTIAALVRYGRISSFHTYLAKCAALLQRFFLLLLFFLPEWPLLVFHIAALVTMLDLAEEIILVMLLPAWKTDVKGLYWVVNKKKDEI